jgi:thiol-disulfide isomerase/thioredoxin
MVRFAAAALALLATLLGSQAVGAEILLLDFWSPHCGPCLQMKPTIRNFEQAGYPIRQVDTTREPILARQYGVERIPCFVMLVDNQEVDRQVGFTSGQRLQEMFARAKAIVQDRAGRRGQSPDATAPTPPAPAPGAWPVAATASSATLETGQAPNGWHDNLLAASVRLRVEDARGRAYGTGTIIDARSGQALVITCGHLFRESNGKGPVRVEMFEWAAGGLRATGEVRAQLISYNLDRDVALVGIWPNGPVTVAPLAPKGTAIARGDRVVSIGCSNGNDPTALTTRITQLDRYQGPANIEAQGAPVEGRSGGGLFNAQGELIGVCFAADYEANEGLFAALQSIHDELAERGLSDIGGPAAERPSDTLLGGVAAATPIVRGQEPLAPVQPVPDRQPDTPPGAAVADGPSNTAAAVPPGLNDVERAAWEEIISRAATAEVICIIRPKEPGGQSEVITLDDVSPELVRALAARARGSQGTVKR